MKDIERRLVSELMKNCRRSDRTLAKALGVSQPTVTRTLHKLEKEGYIKEYAMIPDFAKLGYELMSVSFINVKNNPRHAENEAVIAAATEEVDKKVFPDLLIERGMGLGFDGIVITLHRSFSDYKEQMDYTKARPFVQTNRVESFLIDLKDSVHFRNLTLSLVADDLIKKDKEDTKRS